MITSILASIICDQYEREYHRNDTTLRKQNGMKVKFSLSPDYEIEDGYRNLSVLLYDFGNNYVGVFGKLDWTVIKNEWQQEDDGQLSHDYIKGDTGWVLLGYHDSCWRDSLCTLIRAYAGIMITADCLFGGWHKKYSIDDLLRNELYNKIRQRDKDGRSPKLNDLEFKF